MNKNQTIIVLVIVLFLAVAGAVFALQQNASQMPASVVAPVSTATTTTISNPPQSGTTPSPTPKPTPVPTPVPESLSLTSISPSSGPAGTVVTLHGSGFDSTSQVAFSNGALHPTSVNAAGTVMTFTMPSDLGAYCRTGQACAMYLILLKSGTYDLTIKNDDGSISNAVQFTLTGTANSL